MNLATRCALLTGSVIVWVLVAAPANADDAASLTPQQAADHVVAAFRSHDLAALKELASERRPLPWQVGDVLVRREHYDAAMAFACIAPGARARWLPAYVGMRRAMGPDREAWKIWTRVQAAHQSKAWAQIVEETEHLPPADSATDLRLRWRRGLALRHLGRVPESIRAFAETAVACERIGWLQLAADNWHESARSAYDVEDWKSARSAWQSRLALVEEFDEVLPLAGTLNNLGLVALSLGNLDEALAHLRQALAIARSLRMEEREKRILNNLGLTCAALGRYAEALRHYERALVLQRKADDPVGMAATLHNLAAVEHRLGRLRDAQGRYQQVLKIERARDNVPGIMDTLTNLGAVQAADGDHEAALQTFNEAIELARATKDRYREGRLLHSIGGVYFDRRDFVSALRHYAVVEKILRAGQDRLALAKTLTQIARTHRLQERFAQALVRLKEAQSLLVDAPQSRLWVEILALEAHVHAHRGAFARALALSRDAVARAMPMARGLAEGEGANARDEFERAFQVGVRAAFQTGDLPALAWFIERSRADSLREGLAARDALQQALLDGDLRGEVRQVQRREEEAWAQYQAALRTGIRQAARDARHAYEDARRASVRIDARIQVEAKSAAPILLPEADDLAQIQQNLRASEALVLYAFGLDKAIALIVRQHRVRSVSLGGASVLRNGVQRLLGHAERHIDTSHLAALRQLVVAPLTLSDDVKRVLVSPTGRLGYVPFGLLFPKRIVRYVPSGTILGLLRATEYPAGTFVLALGDPQYGPSSRLAPLPGTREEVRVVGDVRLFGAEATEPALRAALRSRPRWRAIHFACHGLIDAQRPMYSALALAPHRGDDGRLTCLDVFRLSMPADLVVLSACDTAQGKIYRTEGIVGLTRAFLYAGAPQVLCSLWKVDDQATRALMVKFYALWNPKDGAPRLDAATALKQAQAHVASHEKWEHPYFWAAWVLWGLGN